MKTAIHKEVDRLIESLTARNITVKRTEVFEMLAHTKGYKNSNAMMADDKAMTAKAKDERHPLDDPMNPESIDALKAKNADLKRRNHTLENNLLSSYVSGFDWREWTRTVKEACHHNKAPVDDKNLEIIRLAVADNHSKSSSSERSSAETKVAELGKRFLPAILARMDAAEEKLGQAASQDIDQEIEFLNKVMIVSANRDAIEYDAYFEDQGSEDANNILAARMCAKAYGIAEMMDETLNDDDNIDDLYDNCMAELEAFHVSRYSIEIPIADMLKAITRGEGAILAMNIMRKDAEAIREEMFPDNIFNPYAR